MEKYSQIPADSVAAGQPAGTVLAEHSVHSGLGVAGRCANFMVTGFVKWQSRGWTFVLQS